MKKQRTNRDSKERIAVLEFRVQEQQEALKKLKIGIQGLENLLKEIAENPMGLLKKD